MYVIPTCTYSTYMYLLYYTCTLPYTAYIHLCPCIHAVLEYWSRKRDVQSLTE